ncbi:MAG TPA: GNAT family N-acetyltransferase [Gemmatimonadaceae bacterium]
MALTDITVKYLEMKSPGELRAKRSPLDGVAVARVAQPVPELNRFLYAAVGVNYHWFDRIAWSREQWREYVESPDVETWVLTLRGIPGGYFELEHHANGDIEIKYFGLLTAFIGRGLGAHMLTVAAETAWAAGATRVIVDTCSLDHPNAFAHYIARGFQLYRTVVVTKDVPVEDFL